MKEKKYPKINMVQAEKVKKNLDNGFDNIFKNGAIMNEEVKLEKVPEVIFNSDGEFTIEVEGKSKSLFYCLHEILIHNTTYKEVSIKEYNLTYDETKGNVNGIGDAMAFISMYGKGKVGIKSNFKTSIKFSGDYIESNSICLADVYFNNELYDDLEDYDMEIRAKEIVNYVLIGF